MIPIHPFQMNYISRNIIKFPESTPSNFFTWKSIIAKYRKCEKYCLFIQGRESLEIIRPYLEKTPSFGQNNLYNEAFNRSQFDSNIIEIVYDLRRLQMQGHAEPTPWKAIGYHSTPEELSYDLEINYEDVECYRRIEFEDFYRYIKRQQGNIIL